MIKIDDLKKLSIFPELTDEELASTGARTEVRNFKRNEQLVLEGNSCGSLYIVAKGKIKIFKTSREGREHIFYYAGRNETFCEQGAFDGTPSPLSATAATDGTLYYINEKNLKTLISKIPNLALALLKIQSARMRQMTEIVEGLSFKNVPGRIARILSELAENEGVEMGGNVMLKRSITLYEMASMAGTVREVVTRALQELERKGYLMVKRHEIVITDLKSLQNL